MGGLSVAEELAEGLAEVVEREGGVQVGGIQVTVELCCRLSVNQRRWRHQKRTGMRSGLWGEGFARLQIRPILNSIRTQYLLIL